MDAYGYKLKWESFCNDDKDEKVEPWVPKNIKYV